MSDWSESSTTCNIIFSLTMPIATVGLNIVPNFHPDNCGVVDANDNSIRIKDLTCTCQPQM